MTNPRSRSKSKPWQTRRDQAYIQKSSFSVGASSWEWPAMHISSQKVAWKDKCDPRKSYFKKGAPMPLMVYIGERGRTRRSPEARARRSDNAAARGWDRDRIEAMKRGEASSNRGSGATSWSGYQGNSSSSATPWLKNVDWSQNCWNQYWRDGRESGWR